MPKVCIFVVVFSSNPCFYTISADIKLYLKQQQQKKKDRKKVSVFMLINPLMTGGPIWELKAGHGVDYCHIFISGGD